MKDKATYLFLLVSISSWETDLQQVYDQRLNQLVYYLTPDTTLKLEKAKVKLSDRRLSATYAFLKDSLDKQTIFRATITGKNKDGYFATIMDGEISSFILFKENEVMPELEKRQQVEVVVKSLYENGVRIQLVG